MNNLVENLITTLILVALALTAWFMAQDSKKFSATIPTPVAFFETSLQSSITDTDTSMTLVDFETADGTNLATGTTYGFIIDEGSSNQEAILGTASTSNQIVSMTRGVSAVTGRTEISDLKSAHRRGASVKITDAPVLLTLARILNGDDTVPNKLTYESQPSFSSNEDITTKKYVDDTVSAGAPDAGLSTKGLVEQGTTSELATGASSGDTSAPLFAPLQFFNTSASATTVPVTDNSGKLAQGWLDLTEDFSFGGALSVSGNSTLSGNMSVAGTSTFDGTSTFSEIDTTGAQKGDMWYYDGNKWEELSASTSGAFLESQGTSSAPQWGPPLGAATTSTSTENIQQQDDTTVSGDETSWTEANQFQVNKAGTVRVTADFKATNNTYTAYMQFGKDGQRIGSSYSETNGSYKTVVMDIDIALGTEVEIWRKVSDFNTDCSIKNFRIYYKKTSLSN